MKQAVKGDIKIELQREGQGRFDAFLSRPGHGRVRIGTVLGGRRSWTGEPVGNAPSIQGTSRAAVMRGLGA